MSRFKKLTHVIWHCQYHLVWIPKYRYRVLTGAIGREIANCIEVYSSRLRCEVVELNVQKDHVHFMLKVPPKISISHLMGVRVRYGYSQDIRIYGRSRTGATTSGPRATVWIR